MTRREQELERELKAANDLCMQQLKKIQRLEKRLARLERKKNDSS